MPTRQTEVRATRGARTLACCVETLLDTLAPRQPLPLTDVAKLLASRIQEHRSAALEILAAQYEREKSRAIFDFYLKHTKFVNNWDLVDGSAPYIVGQHLLASDHAAIRHRTIPSAPA